MILYILLAQAQAKPPSFEELIPWVIYTLFGMVTGFGVWIMRIGQKKLEAVTQAIMDNKDSNILLAKALIILSLKVHNPDADIQEMATEVLREVERKK